MNGHQDKKHGIQHPRKISLTRLWAVIHGSRFYGLQYGGLLKLFLLRHYVLIPKEALSRALILGIGCFRGLSQSPLAAGSEFRRLTPNARHAARLDPNHARIKKSLLVLCLICWSLLGLGCPDSPSSIKPFTQALFDLAERADRTFTLDLPSSLSARDDFFSLVQKARAALKRHGMTSSSPSKKTAEQILNHLLFTELGVGREVNDKSLRWMMLPEVLIKKKGSCLGLAGLYLSLAEHLQLPIHGVLVPGHFFVRFDNKHRKQNIELLKSGQAMPRAWYLSKYHPPKGNRLYLRNLTSEESLAVFLYNLANEFRLRGDLPEAIALYQQVTAHLPDFAEAQANLGLCYQKQRDFTRAEKAYQRAKRAFSGLPGLEHNLSILRRQMHPPKEKVPIR